MYEETLALITEGVFSLTQICEAVLILSKFYPNDKKRSLEMTDSLWTGVNVLLKLKIILKLQ